MQDRAVFRDLPADTDGHTDWRGAYLAKKGRAYEINRRN